MAVMDVTWPLFLALVTATNNLEPAAAFHLPTLKDLLAILAPPTNGPVCNILEEGFKPEEEEALVKKHNEFRSSITGGKVEKFPKAADMNMLVR
ncbi:hypothetical protein V5799_030705 [Amblyomma americanum]|uniref:Secreted protein n=1 Tax=Amblyomma americanum TaxID=6943 RepID=A0AAQ4EMF5_AMBAM